MSQPNDNTKRPDSRSHRKRFLRVELLETRSLLAGDVFGYMDSQFDNLDLNSSSTTRPTSETAEVSSEQANFETWLMKVAVFDEDAEAEGEPPAGAQAEPTAATRVPQGPALPSLIQFVERNDSQLVEPPAPASSDSLISSSQVGEQSSISGRASEQITSSEPSIEAADVVFSFGLQYPTSASSALGNSLPNNAYASDFKSLPTNSLISSPSNSVSNLLGTLSSSSKRYAEQQELGSLLNDLAQEHFKTGFQDLLSDSASNEKSASEQVLVDHDTPVEIREAMIEVQNPTGEILDGLMAMEIPQDLLPNHSELLEHGKDGVWAVPLGVYRQGEVALGNAALAQANDAMNTARSKESDREVENTGQLIIAYLRPIAAATSVAFGAIFIGFKRQTDRDDEVRKQFEQLR